MMFLYLKPLGKLLISIIVVPVLVSWIQLDNYIRYNEMCLVGPVVPFSLHNHGDESSTPPNFDPYKTHSMVELRGIYGVYQPQISQRTTRKIPLKSLHNRRFSVWDEDRNTSKGSFFSYVTFGYPSLVNLAERISFGKYNGQKMNVSNIRSSLLFNESKQSWCFHFTNTEQEPCITIKDGQGIGYDALGVRIFPPSGRFQVETSSNSKPVAEIMVTCPQGEFVSTKASFLSSWLNPFPSQFRKNPDKTMIEPINSNLDFVQLPATTLLIALNVLLALVYWKNQTDPSSVCKEYKKIVLDNELYRSFTGATAHFEPLHLGFNMMSLYALGSELELRYGSIPFLFRNIALIPMTTIVMMTIVWLQIRYTGNDQLKYTRTVGYSAVLFAWMVISSLERNSTCPVPFAPDMCFNTHVFTIGLLDLKWNFGPLVQLVLAQIIMPRVSFIGHLAGIICGFIMHWNLLWQEIVWSPQVLIPLLQFIHLWTLRGPLLTYRRITSTSEMISPHHSMGISSKVFVGTFVSMVLSSLVWKLFSGPVFNEILVVLFLNIAFNHTNESIGNLSEDGPRIYRYTFLTIILTIITDAISFPYIWKTKNLLYSNMSVYSFTIFGAVLAFRFLTNIMALLFVSNEMRERYRNNYHCGPFEILFGWIIEQGHLAFPSINSASRIKHSTNSYFEGQGHVLGSV
jgi:membrane associated rhomboid family serine protease